MYSMGFNRRDVGPWETQYCAYSTVFLGKDNLDEGDKVILPESALVALGTHARTHLWVYSPTHLFTHPLIY